MVLTEEIAKRADALAEGADAMKNALGNAADAKDELIEGGTDFNIDNIAQELLAGWY